MGINYNAKKYTLSLTSDCHLTYIGRSTRQVDGKIDRHYSKL